MWVTFVHCHIHVSSCQIDAHPLWLVRCSLGPRSLLPGKFILLFLLLLTFISSYQYGYHISALNQLQAVLTCQHFVPDSFYGLPTCIPMSDATFSLVTSMFTVGGLLGSLSANLAMDRYGRKGASRLSAVFNIAGAAISCLATSVAPMALGRFEFSPNLNKI